MELFDSLGLAYPQCTRGNGLASHGFVLSLVGAGGKTMALYSLARSAAARGLCVLVTTTTHLVDPRSEHARPYDDFLLDPQGKRYLSEGGRAGKVALLGSRIDEGTGKLVGVSADLIKNLAEHFDLILVEADGSRGLPVKAPAEHEPELPDSSDLVLGVMGLDALGLPATESHVHRLGDFLRLSGAAPGQPISPEHLAAIAASRDGLFKRCPSNARRVALLSKADLADPRVASDLARLVAASGCCDLVLVASKAQVLESFPSARSRP